MVVGIENVELVGLDYRHNIAGNVFIE